MKHSCVEGSNVDNDNESAPENIPNLNQVHEVAHKLIKVPPYSKFFGGRWVKCYQQKYQQHKCHSKNCKSRIRTVCTCSKDVFRCVSCFGSHYVEEVTSPQSNDRI